MRFTLSDDGTKALIRPLPENPMEALTGILKDYPGALAKERVMVHPSAEIVWKGAEIKACHPIAYADCPAGATALQRGASLVTGDPDFKEVEHLVEVEQVRD